MALVGVHRDWPMAMPFTSDWRRPNLPAAFQIVHLLRFLLCGRRSGAILVSLGQIREVVDMRLSVASDSHFGHPDDQDSNTQAQLFDSLIRTLNTMLESIGESPVTQAGYTRKFHCELRGEARISFTGYYAELQDRPFVIPRPLVNESRFHGYIVIVASGRTTFKTERFKAIEGGGDGELEFRSDRGRLFTGRDAHGRSFVEADLRHATLLLRRAMSGDGAPVTMPGGCNVLLPGDPRVKTKHIRSFDGLRGSSLNLGASPPRESYGPKKALGYVQAQFDRNALSTLPEMADWISPNDRLIIHHQNRDAFWLKNLGSYYLVFGDKLNDRTAITVGRIGTLQTTRQVQTGEDYLSAVTLRECGTWQEFFESLGRAPKVQELRVKLSASRSRAVYDFAALVADSEAKSWISGGASSRDGATRQAPGASIPDAFFAPISARV